MSENKRKGLLIVVSGPAGSGKGTVVSLVREKMPDIGFSVSATTRKPRPGEVDGVHYYFISREAFLKKVELGQVLEYTEYCDNYYGTLRSEAERVLSEGHDLILDIEVDGASQIKKQFPDAVCIMLVPSDKETLEARLRGRGTETDDVIAERLARAREELGYLPNYDYVLINGTGMAGECADDFITVIRAERLKAERQKSFIESFFDEPSNG